MPNIAVYGAFSPLEDDFFTYTAFDIGSEIARRGYNILCYGANTPPVSNLVAGALGLYGMVYYVVKTEDEFYLSTPGITNVMFNDPIECLHEKGRIHLVLPGTPVEDLLRLFTLRNNLDNPEPLARCNPVYLLDDEDGRNQELYATLTEKAAQKLIDPQVFAGVHLASWLSIFHALKDLEKPQLVIVNS